MRRWKKWFQLFSARIEICNKITKRSDWTTWATIAKLYFTSSSPAMEIFLILYYIAWQYLNWLGGESLPPPGGYKRKLLFVLFLGLVCWRSTVSVQYRNTIIQLKISFVHGRKKKNFKVSPKFHFLGSQAALNCKVTKQAEVMQYAKA